MIENLYTTKMSVDKKTLQNRFTKIRSKNGRLSKLMELVMSCIIVVTMIGAAVAAAAIDGFTENNVKVFYNNTEQKLKHQPFINESEIYVPLREVMNICGVSDSDISYNKGNIKIRFTSQNIGVVEAEIRIGQNGIAFDKDDNIMGIDKIRTTTHPAVLVNNTAYIPAGMVMRIKNYYTAEDFDDRIYLNLLGTLEIRRYAADGKYDAVVCAPIDVNGDDKYNPQNYYNKDERVVIGTCDEFDAQFEAMQYGHNEINGYYYPTDAKKHILVDENGRVIAVVPYEDFRHECINPAPIGTSTWENAVLYYGNKRGGADVFVNAKRTLSDGKEHNFALLYCFVDFRYFVK